MQTIYKFKVTRKLQQQMDKKEKPTLGPFIQEYLQKQSEYKKELSILETQRSKQATQRSPLKNVSRFEPINKN